MSKRPLSVDEILQNGSDTLARPTFLSRAKRDELRVKKAPPKRVPKKPISVTTPQNSAPVNTPNLKKTKSTKFSFDWDLNEDTSEAYEPLVAYQSAASNDSAFQLIHWSEKPLLEMSERDWRIFRDDYNITSKGGNIPDPLRLWEESKMPASLLDVLIKTLGYSLPTPIQRAAIPLALVQRDLVGIAETGSGKTLAFLLPLLAYIQSIDRNYLEYEHTRENNHNKPLGLVLAPTRELALQITKEAQKFGDLLGFNTVSIIGGHQYEETIHSVRNGVHIVVATPGRLIDSLERNIISLEKCYYFTMDEADKMIDMGFEKSLQAILAFLPTTQQLLDSADSRLFNVSKRTTLMFTATISPPIEKITKNYLVDPGYLFIGNANEAIDNIDQRFEYLGPASGSNEDLDPKHLNKLLGVLKEHTQRSRDYSIIIFANFKRVCESLSHELEQKGFKENTVIHGSKSQDAREHAIETFRSGKASILIATDVAARGIDVPNVSLVVNYQMPNKFEEYIHRIGRTGRAGRKGASISFVDDSDSKNLLDLKKFLTKGRKKIPDWLARHSATQSHFLKD